MSRRSTRFIEALAARGLAPAPLFVTSLKDAESAAFLRDAMRRLKPSLIVTTTAFAATASPDEPTPLDEAGVPVLQAVVATTRRAAWADSPRGLGAADLAMHVVLPELDGRVLAGVVAFKAPSETLAELAFAGLANQPEPDRIDAVADRIAAWVHLQQHAARRAAHRGAAAGLSRRAGPHRLCGRARRAGERQRAARRSRGGGLCGVRRAAVIEGAARCVGSRRRVDAARNLSRVCSSDFLRTSARKSPPPGAIPTGAFHFRAKTFGNVIVALPPDRGRRDSRRADYHDPALPPRHALLAFGLWLRHVAKVDAIVHMGAHGTLEWLPGKAVALTAACFPEAVVGPLPVIYPFIVSNPGEAAQAKRRIAAVTLGHMPPPLVDADLSGDARELERLVDEYAQADGLDRRRRERLARLIVESAQRSGLAGEAGVDAQSGPDEALRRIDAWLCDLKDLAIKDGQHIYGGAGERAPRAARRARRPPHPAGPGRLAAPRAPRRCSRPAATSSPPIRARCRRRPRWTSGGSPPTR